MRKQSYWSLVAINLGIITLIGFALWFTQSPWVLLCLYFLFSSEETAIETECPKCEHKFMAVRKDIEDEDEE